MAGQYFDQETGLHYNYHRYYDPTTGRYLTPDPIGLVGGINPFAYTFNNPVNLIDPYGLDAGIISGPAAVYGAIAAGTAATIWWYNNKDQMARDIDRFWKWLRSENTEEEDGGCEDEGGDPTTWPDTSEGMDELLGVEGKDVPDGPTTPGRNKKEWKPNEDTKITYEEHPYHPDAPDWHKGPHWHLDTPGKRHKRYLPGEKIPGL